MSGIRAAATVWYKTLYLRVIGRNELGSAAVAQKHPDDRIGGYYASFLAFAGITALWAFIVREDAFYGSTPLFGVLVPVTTVVYLLTMPLIGYLIGRWRYDAADINRGAFGFLGKGVARALNFAYSHLLIVLFTIAMVTDAFFNWNIDAAVETIDDNLFAVASRFAPWLAAYLAGFNLGRAMGLTAWRKRQAARDDLGPLTAFPAQPERSRSGRETAEVTIHRDAGNRRAPSNAEEPPAYGADEKPSNRPQARGRGPYRERPRADAEPAFEDAPQRATQQPRGRRKKQRGVDRVPAEPTFSNEATPADDNPFAQDGPHRSGYESDGDARGRDNRDRAYDDDYFEPEADRSKPAALTGRREARRDGGRRGRGRSPDRGYDRDDYDQTESAHPDNASFYDRPIAIERLR